MLVLDRVPGASARITALLDEVGVPWEPWDAAEIAARVPALDPGAYGPPAPVDSAAFFADAHGVVATIASRLRGRVITVVPGSSSEAEGVDVHRLAAADPDAQYARVPGRGGRPDLAAVDARGERLDVGDSLADLGGDLRGWGQVGGP